VVQVRSSSVVKHMVLQGFILDVTNICTWHGSSLKWLASTYYYDACRNERLQCYIHRIDRGCHAPWAVSIFTHAPSKLVPSRLEWTFVSTPRRILTETFRKSKVRAPPILHIGNFRTLFASFAAPIRGEKFLSTRAYATIPWEILWPQWQLSV
jgi:hypothetical protein